MRYIFYSMCSYESGIQEFRIFFFSSAVQCLQRHIYTDLVIFFTGKLALLESKSDLRCVVGVLALPPGGSRFEP